MISVLIPIFNYDVTALVASLISQLALSNIDYEIICIDDASTNYCLENDNLKLYNNTVLYKLSVNIGRSKIRNLLAEKAKYNWLLFLDADVFPKVKNFIKTYLKHINSNSGKVFCGGIIYQKEKPQKNKTLRWVYGKNREEVDAQVRQRNPYRYFFGANILMHKSVFDTCKFNEMIVKYGYEDILFVEDLKTNAIDISHLNNLVYHLGIENNILFLSKTKQALENLYSLNTLKILSGRDVKILQTYGLVKKYKLNRVLSLVYTLFNKIIEINLKSSVPSLVLFDLYKLTYFCYLADKKITPKL